MKSLPPSHPLSEFNDGKESIVVDRQTIYRAPMPNNAPHGEVRWRRFGGGDVIPQGTVFITKIPSGYGYNFWNVCHAETDLVATKNEDLGHRKGTPGFLYCGRYRQRYSTLQGLFPDSIVRVLEGCFSRWEDIPEEVHLFAQDMSSASLEKA